MKEMIHGGSGKILDVVCAGTVVSAFDEDPDSCGDYEAQAIVTD